ncbi:hypothetical protein ABZ914_06975 [Spirillospora sp. NPDC046719]
MRRTLTTAIAVAAGAVSAPVSATAVTGVRQNPRAATGKTAGGTAAILDPRMRTRFGARPAARAPRHAASDVPVDLMLLDHTGKPATEDDLAFLTETTTGESPAPLAHPHEPHALPPSQHTDSATLPLLAVRYRMTLDEQNRATAGADQHFEVRVERPGGAVATDVTKLTVDASFDDGTTWQPVTLTWAGDHWTAALRNAADAQHVSLRARAAGTTGDAVDQTLIHAYGITR